MTARLHWLLALALVGACQAKPSTAPKKPGTPTQVAQSSEPASVYQLLQPPAGGATPLIGKVKIDASYVVAVKAGNILSNNSAGVVAAGGGIISDHGGGLISNNSGNIVAAPGGNVISDQGGSLVADQGGGIISDHGGGLIGNNSGSLIGKVKRTLLAEDAPAYGTQLPAVGMRILAISGRTGNLVPLGQDRDGKPVYAIYTALDGSYKVYIPEEIQDYVRVVAVVPDRKEARLGYNVFARPGGPEGNIDEDLASTTQYLRRVLRAKFENLLVLNDQSGGGGVPSDKVVEKFFSQARAPEFVAGLLMELIKELFAEVAKNKNISRGSYGPLAQRLGDALLTRATDLEGLTLDPSYFGRGETAETLKDTPYASGKALANMRAIMQEFRDRVAAKGGSLEGTRAYFENKPYITSANAFHFRLFPDQGPAFYTIEKPSDLADFLSREYFPLVPGVPYGCAQGDCPPPDDACTIVDGCIPPGGVATLSNAQIFALPKLVMRDLGLPETHVGVLNAVGSSVSFAVGTQLADPDLKADLLALVRDYKGE
jgi:hypothetical protein